MGNIQNISAKWVWAIIILGALMFCFYWFSIRVENIKKECFQKNVNYGQNYDACLRQNGLE